VLARSPSGHTRLRMISVTATAPVRIADAGGWTDTWFAGHGVVCNVAARPGAICRIEATAGAGNVELIVPTYGDHYWFRPAQSLPGLHPLLELAIQRHLPGNVDLSVTVDCAMPPGSAVGTSAAVCVALIGALVAIDRAASGTRATAVDTGIETSIDPVTVARHAHEIEIGLGWQSGIQDQLAAATGGPALVTMSRYPVGEVTLLPESTLSLLHDSMLTVYLGKPHHSSDIHSHVIASLEQRHDADALLDPLRVGARAAADALTKGDLHGYADALVSCTEAQRRLHPSLVSDDAQIVIDGAQRHGALGWKVNGAGGDGGSVTLVGPGSVAALRVALKHWTILDLVPCRQGLTVQPGLH
jgi:D-glycero-alpha-D-manno-heptose-7-phosphate kinase